MWKRGLESPFPDTAWEGWPGKGGEALSSRENLEASDCHGGRLEACLQLTSSQSPPVTPVSRKVAFCHSLRFCTSWPTFC